MSQWTELDITYLPLLTNYSCCHGRKRGTWTTRSRSSVHQTSSISCSVLWRRTNA